jgi:hypothetical protein
MVYRALPFPSLSLVRFLAFISISSVWPGYLLGAGLSCTVIAMTAPPGLSVSPSPYSLFRQSSASSLLLHGQGSRSPSSPDDPHNVTIPDHFESPPVGRMQGTISDTEELALIASPREVLQNRSSLRGDVQGMSSEEFGLACDGE